MDKKEKFNHKEYYRKNKTKINEYNKKYFKDYYNVVLKHKKIYNDCEEPLRGCIIKCNVICSL